MAKIYGMVRLQWRTSKAPKAAYQQSGTENSGESGGESAAASAIESHEKLKRRERASEYQA